MRADEIFARANNEHTFGQQQTSISQKLKKKRDMYTIECF